MTAPIEISRVSTSSGRHAAQPTMSRPNTLLALLVVAVVALAPLPFGSVRGFFSSFWSTAIGLSALLYFGWAGVRQARLRIYLRALVLPGLLYMAVLLYLLVQTLAIFAPTEISPGTLSIDPDTTLMMLVRQAGYMLFVVLAVQVLANAQRRARILDVLLVVSVGYALFGFYSLYDGDTIFGLPKWAYLGSATGPFVNRNSFSTYLALGTILAVGSCAARLADRFGAERIRGNGTAIVLTALAALVLASVTVLTQSRMGTFVAGIGSLVAIGVLGLRLRGRPAWLMLAATGVGGVGATVYALKNGLVDRLGTVGTDAGTRLDLYAQTLELIRQRPLTGYGGGTFELAFPLVHRPPVNPDLLWDRGHNTYLSLWLDMGFVFGSLPVLAVLILVGMVVLGLRRSDPDRPVIAIAVGSTLAVALHSLVDFSLEIPGVTYFFLILLSAGLAAALPKTSRTANA